MKKATIVHLEEISLYFQDGEQIVPTAEEKLRNSIFPFLEIQVMKFRTEIEVITYKTKKELQSKFQSVVEQFQSMLNPLELVIEHE